MSVPKKFKGSDMEKELESLYADGLIDQTVTAKEAYDMSFVFKRDVTFDKFSPKYYNWKRKKAWGEESQRTGGNGPPEGKFFSGMSVYFLLELTVSKMFWQEMLAICKLFRTTLLFHLLPYRYLGYLLSPMCHLFLQLFALVAHLCHLSPWQDLLRSAPLSAELTILH